LMHVVGRNGDYYYNKKGKNHVSSKSSFILYFISDNSGTGKITYLYFIVDSFYY
jgi:hypothetical protein